MTVREAVQLVLQASALGVAGADQEAGKIYVLDMGEPIRIIDLARQMIRLAGLSPDIDIEIKMIGLRPGEKLHEELFHEAELLLPTANPGLRLASPRTVDLEFLDRGFDELAALATSCREGEILAMIHRLVPELSRPELSESDSPDHDIEADAAAVAACVTAAYSHYIERMGKPPGPMLDDYAKIIADHRVFILDGPEGLAGALVLIDQEGGLMLDNVAIHPDYQGRGLGRRLIAFAEDEARRLGFSALDLYSHESMTENLALYGALGFVEIERRVVSGYARVYMRKELSPLPK
jgi:ribosomal protein S18 acetylase RimI-like enzyme